MPIAMQYYLNITESNMYKLIRDEEERFKALSKLDNDLPLFVDTETCPEYGKTDPSKKPGGLYGDIRLIQLYQKGMKHALLFDCFFVDLDTILRRIKNFHHVYHNASYDLHTINCHTTDYYFPAEVGDTFYLSKSVFPEKERFGFYDCLAHADLEDDAIRNIDKKENQMADWAKDLTPTMKRYAAMDVLYLSLLYDKVKHGMDESCQLDHDNLKYAVCYDRVGIPMNRKKVRALRQDTLVNLEKYKELVPVNPNSPKQCKEWLGLTGTDAEILGIAALEGNKDAENLIKARKYSKLLMFINKYDGERIRAFHNACGARTSRMTCSGGDRLFYENNQNPPRNIFPCIEAPDGKMIVYKDYSGLELRMAVAYVGEPTMARLMMEGKDLHTETGCKLFNKTVDTLTKGERLVTKFFNFGTAYGAGPVVLRGLLRARGRIDLSFNEVRDIREKWLDIYEYFREWHDMHKRAFNVYGYIDTDTALGRTIRAYKLTDSYNFPIQGSAAEVTKLAVHYLYERYGEPDIINVVHDSIALEKPEDEVDIWVERLNECMVDAWYHVIKSLALPDLVMPAEAQYKKTWEFD